MVSARIHAVDNIPLAATLARRLAIEKSHVGFAWSRAEFDAVTRVAVRSATSLVFLTSNIRSCPHRGACKLPCAVPCDLLPCSKRCSLRLSCGHQCPFVCGEICPDVQHCQQCADKSVEDMMVDYKYIMGSSYAELDLDESPCLIPSCDHILTLESMDGHVDMFKYYTMSSDTNIKNPIIALKSSSVPFSTSELKNCPLCRKPLHNINWYGRIVQRAWIDEATKKHILWADAQFVPLTSRIEQAEAKL